jgi:Ca-activated chloride channel family protein
MRVTHAVRAFVALGIILGAVSPGEAARLADIVVTGTVRSETGSPLAQAQVYIAEATISVATNDSGGYRIAIPGRLSGSSVILRARAIGYAPSVRQLLVTQDTVVHFTLKRDVIGLEEVTVTGRVEGTERAKVPFSIGRVDGGAPAPGIQYRRGERDLSSESYSAFVDNGFESPIKAPRSTFGVDVDRASYSNVRRLITVDNRRPPRDAVRVEEMLNYFPYDYPAPRGRHPFAVTADVAVAPWAPSHRIVRIGLQARTIELEDAPPSNLVFLIDVSGSMQPADKLPLLKQAFFMLVEQLREQDRIAIVVYAGSSGLVLPSTSGADKQAILRAINQLDAGGSTAGGAGLRLAYDIARQNFRRDGNNRVILATDGDFNVGVTDNGELQRYVEERRAEGTALTVLGFGAGNIKDDRMEMLANKGNGNYHYIDSALEARKVLVEEMGGTLITVAKDVKLQVEFNPAVVARYRLIGYENRVLADKDFKDDRKDAGEMGAGHSVTALYEIIPVGADDAERGFDGESDTLRYSRRETEPRRQPRVVVTGDDREMLFVRLRYKEPTGETSIPFEVVVPNRVTAASTDFRFAQAVAAFGMTLRESEHRGKATAEMALELARESVGRDPGGYRADFVKLVSAYLALPEVRTASRER